jgi:hypothetical protein
MLMLASYLLDRGYGGAHALQLAIERHGQLILDCRSQASPSPGIPTWSMVWCPTHDSGAGEG